MALHRAFYKLECGLAIAPLAGKDLKHFAFAIYGAPQLVYFAADPNENLIQMPTHWIWVRIEDDRFFLIFAANVGPNRFHQARTVWWQMSIPRSWSKSSTCRNDSGKRTYIITARRITSGDVLK